MAGIGFKLQKILSDQTYSGSIKGYFFAAVITSGPWILSVIGVGLLGIASPLLVGVEKSEIFRTIVVYSYAFSLIFTGLFQMVVTRYVSDRLYAQDEDAVLPTFVRVLFLSTIFLFVSGFVFYSFVPLSIHIRTIAVLLFIVIGNIWMVMVFLSSLRNYNSIISAFVIGVILSFLGGYVLGKEYNLLGLLGGYFIGQLYIFLALSSRIFQEFKFVKSLGKEFFHYFLQYPQLIFIGFLYNFGIWIDKFVFWFFAPGKQVLGPLWINTYYDSVMYLAFLTIIPSMSLFLIRIETSFYNHYRDFYGAIVNRLPLSVIREKKKLMVESIHLSTYRLFTIQGLISIVAIFLAPYLIEPLHLEWRQLHIFRIGILGSFLHALMLILSIIIQYYDFRNLSLLLAFLFCVFNGIFSWISLQFGFAFYGYGYFASTLLTTIIGYILFAKKMDQLEYITFMQQPIQTYTQENV